MRRLRTLLAALATVIGHALAGSRVWQPTASISADRLDPRYYTINLDRGANTDDPRTTWPNRQIRYCFENDEARTALNDLIIAAHEVWLTKGLHSSFTIAEVGDDECTGSDRLDSLLIRWTGDNGGMGTFVGFLGAEHGLRQSENPQERPEMRLTTSVNMGMLDQVANFAHELGHAWGLYHEHQNPAFWNEFATVNGKGGTVFGPNNNGNWRCENLKDYAAKKDELFPAIVVQDPNRPPRERIPISVVCKSQALSEDHRFSAADYLPFVAGTGVSHSNGGNEKDVDWDSIMIYPSGAGAIGEASPGNDQRAAILLKPNGDRIPINLTPSQIDISGLHKLYGKENKAKQLLQKAGGTVTSSFRKIFPKSAGSSSCL